MDEERFADKDLNHMSFEQVLPCELIVQILDHLPDVGSLVSVCSVNKFMRNLRLSSPVAHRTVLLMLRKSRRRKQALKQMFSVPHLARMLCEKKYVDVQLSLSFAMQCKDEDLVQQIMQMASQHVCDCKDGDDRDKNHAWRVLTYPLIQHNRLDLLKLLPAQEGSILSYCFSSAVRTRDPAMIRFVISQLQPGFIDVSCLFEMEDGQTLLRKILKTRPDISLYPQSLTDITKWDDVELLQMAFDRGATDINSALHGAALNASVRALAFLTDKGADAWAVGLAGAIEGKHQELIGIFLEKPYQLTRGLFYSCASAGNLELLREFAMRGRLPPTSTVWSGCLEDAAKNSQEEIIRYIMERKKPTRNWRVRGIIKSDRMDVIDWLIRSEPDLLKIIVKECCANGTIDAKEVFGHLRNAGHMIPLPSLCRGLFSKQAAEFFMDYPLSAIDLNRMLVLAAERGNYELMSRCIDAGATDFNAAIRSVEHNYHFEDDPHFGDVVIFLREMQTKAS